MSLRRQLQALWRSALTLQDEARPFRSLTDVHDSLADGYWRSGDRARAIAGFQRAIELDPKNEAARQMLEALR